MMGIATAIVNSLNIIYNIIRLINCSEKKIFFRTLIHKPFCKYLKPQIFLNKLPKKISIRDSAAENINMRIENCRRAQTWLPQTLAASKQMKYTKFQTIQTATTSKSNMKKNQRKNQRGKSLEKTLRLATSCILVHIYQIIRRNKSPLVVRKFSVFLLSIDVHHQNKVFFFFINLGKF